MKKVNKIFSLRHFRIISLLLVLNVFVLTTGKDLFHNHKPGETHHNCPVLVIEQILNSGVTIDHFVPSVDFVVIFTFSLPEILLLKYNSPNTYLRAPPIV